MKKSGSYINSFNLGRREVLALLQREGLHYDVAAAQQQWGTSRARFTGYVFLFSLSLCNIYIIYIHMYILTLD